MNILFCSTLRSPSWGGSEELWWNCAIRLLKQGVNVAAACYTRPEKHLEELRAAGGKLYAYPAYYRTLRNALSRRLTRYGLLPDLIGSIKPDFVIHSLPCHVMGVEAIELCLKNRIPYALVVQAAGEQWWPSDPEVQSLRKAYENAVACCFVSHSNAKLVQTQLAFDLPNACVVRNPFKVAYDRATPWPQSDDAGIHLACVGRLDGGIKGQDLILDVLALPKWRERLFTVTFYGKGHNFNSYQQQAKRLGIEKSHFAGHVDDINQLWSRHHGLILPSRAEGLPLAVVEAMLCARPCVVTDVAGNAELIVDNETGFVARAPTVEFVDEALERLWTNRARLEQMGQNAAVHVRQHVPADPVVAFTSQIMSWAAANKTSRASQ